MTDPRPDAPPRWGTDEERRWTRDGPDRPLHQGFQSVYARDYRLPDGTPMMWEMDGLAPVVGVLAVTDEWSCQVRAGLMTGTELAYLALDHAGLL